MWVWNFFIPHLLVWTGAKHIKNTTFSDVFLLCFASTDFLNEGAKCFVQISHQEDSFANFFSFIKWRAEIVPVRFDEIFLQFCFSQAATFSFLIFLNDERKLCNCDFTRFFCNLNFKVWNFWNLDILFLSFLFLSTHHCQRRIR